MLMQLALLVVAIVLGLLFVLAAVVAVR